jgi:ankyrin repeat protein
MELAVQLFKAVGDGNVARVSQLVARGADVNKRDDAQKTPLHVAAHHGHVEVARALITQHGADKEASAEGGMRPLHLAAFDGHVEMVRALIALHGADKEAAAEVGMRPLHVAAMAGHVDVVRALVQLGARPNAQIDDGRTAHAISLSSGHLHVARFLELYIR